MKTARKPIHKILKSFVPVLFIGLIVGTTSCHRHGGCDAYTSDATEITKMKKDRADAARMEENTQNYEQSVGR